MTLGDIRRAKLKDVDQVTACVTIAYQPYLTRIGQPPGPMLDNYAEVIKNHAVWVIEDGESIVGLIVLIDKEEELLLDNIAVRPDYQGRGIGGRLMRFVEKQANKQGFKTIILYTHEKMVENIAMYQKLGYVETERRFERGLHRVYMKKTLNTS